MAGCEAALKLFEQLGARVEPVTPPFAAAELWSSWITLRAMLTFVGDHASVSYSRDGLDGKAISAHLVWMSGDVENDVKAGENRGKKLRHEFVALSIESQPLDPRTGTASFTKPKPAGAKAVAAWIVESGRMEPIQATGGMVEGR